MDLEQEFEKETGFEVYDKTNVKYNGAYVEWLESRIEQLTIPDVVDCKTALKKPTQLKETDFSELRVACSDYIDFTDNDEKYNEDRLSDYENVIFEKAMDATYGVNVWDFINNRHN